jgi:uncharacterized protein (TIGR02118 family)
MVKISILYPNSKDTRFDMPYYLETHMPLAIKLLGGHPGYRGVSVERGIDGALPSGDAAYVAMCHFQFDSLDHFMEAFVSHADVLRGDIPNYTDAVPVFQASEVLISQ